VYKQGIWIPIIPVPLAASPFAIIPEYQPKEAISKWAMIAGELERIRCYEKEGYITSLAETRAYLEWLWKNL
jgi:hypothetical protein